MIDSRLLEAKDIVKLIEDNIYNFNRSSEVVLQELADAILLLSKRADYLETRINQVLSLVGERK